MSEFWMFALVGFVAQLVDGALGMGFGVIAASVLLGQGYAPALVSASINAAKIPTSGTAAISHTLNGNVDFAIVRVVCLYGAIGGILGMLLLVSLKGWLLDAFITAYLLAIGLLIARRGFTDAPSRVLAQARRRVIGFIGGAIEGIGGSWGPVVTTALLGSGIEARRAIGSSNFSEFVVSVVVFSAYMVALAGGYWNDAQWQRIVEPVAGLVVGGLPAAMIGGMLPRLAARRTLTVAVGALAFGVGIYRLL